MAYGHFTLENDGRAMQNSSHNAESGHRNEWLGALAQLVIVFGAAVYTLGWCYLEGYYRSFGISMREVNPPTYDPVMFAFNVLLRPCPMIVVVLAIIVCGWVSHSKTLRILQPWLSVIFFFVAFLAAAGWGGHRGTEQAALDMSEESATFSTVSLVIGTPESGDFLSTENFFAEGDFRLLLHANGQYFVFQPLHEKLHNPTPSHGYNIMVYSIPETRVKEIRIQRGI
jgi:hypothetical protein